VTSSRAADYIPSWSRDGKWIYFGSNRSGEYQVWKVPADRGEAVKVTRNGGFEAFESPDSQWVYYTKGDDVVAKGLWRMPRNGGEEFPVLESVDVRSFAVVKEGIYFVPRKAAGHYSIQFFDFATKRIRSIATIESAVEPYLPVLSVSPGWPMDLIFAD
jgi:hypothetical protein